jgi:hypothetical protein
VGAGKLGGTRFDEEITGLFTLPKAATPGPRAI